MNKNETTVGPMTDEQIKSGIEEGNVAPGMLVRGEDGNWGPIEDSPFASLLPAPRPQQGSLSWVSILATLLLAGLIIAFVTRERSGNPRPATENSPPQKSAFEAQLPRYNELKAQISSVDITTLGEVIAIAGQPTGCRPRPSLPEWSICQWLLTGGPDLVISTTSTGAAGKPSDSPGAWIGVVVFTKQGKQELTLKGTIKQIVDYDAAN